MTVWSGRKALGSIQDTLKKLRDQLEQIDGQIQAASRELVGLRQQEGAHYRRLAGLRLDRLISGEIEAGLEAADRRVAELLADRDQALAALGGEIKQEQHRQKELEKKREEQTDRVTEAAEILDTSEAAVQAALEEDEAYQAQFERAGRADSLATHAEEKTAQAEADRVSKGRPYEEDPLFSYLWKRGYETSRYSGNPLTRFLDKWVAGICGYRDARPNYAMLIEIPKRLREHAARLRAAADRELNELKQLEVKAAEKGGVPEKRASLEREENHIDEIDSQARNTEARLGDLLKERAAFASGEDQYLRQGLDTLSAAFRRENLAALQRYAQATATAEDDVIVDELSDLDQREDELEETVAQHREMSARQLARLREFEGVIGRFKGQRYDDIHSIFGNSGLLALLLNQFLQGSVSGADLWSALQREHRYRKIRSNPLFGSGGFGRGGTWRIPLPRGGGSWRLPIPSGGGWRRGPGRGGFGSKGGFRTGGGV